MFYIISSGLTVGSSIKSNFYIITGQLPGDDLMKISTGKIFMDSFSVKYQNSSPSKGSKLSGEVPFVTSEPLLKTPIKLSYFKSIDGGIANQ